MKININILITIILGLVLTCSPAAAFWVWTPDTGKFVNPKYAVKDTPADQLAFAMEAFNAKNYDVAIKEFQKLIKNYPKAHEAPEAQFYVGLSYELQEKLYDAFEGYQKVIDKYPFSDRSIVVVEKQYDIGMRIIENEKGRNKVMATLKRTDEDILEIFRAVIKNAPYGKLAAPAQYKIGLFLLEKDRHQEAREEFQKLIDDYPDSKWVKAAKYQIAVSDSKRSSAAQYDQKITSKAVKEFKEYVEQFPEAEQVGEAQENIRKLRDKEAGNNFVIAQFYEKQKSYNSAKIYYQSIVDDYPESAWSKKALLKIREMSMKE